MNTLLESRKRARFSRVAQVMLAAALAIFSTSAMAQQPQLTLADILIGLRSKKVTLEERNTILAGAVRERGITFSSTPEIEKELAATGAAKVLLDAVREKSVRIEAPTPTPVPTPVQDFNYFKTRADASFVRGEYSSALADYDRALVLSPDSAVAFLNRGRTYYNLKDFPKAGADLDKAVELDPKDSKALYNRGLLLETKGELEKALADYRNAVEVDPANEPAKAMVKKISDQLEQAKAAERAAAAPPPTPKPEPPPIKVPESVSLGNLFGANAVRMGKPLYSPIAQRSRIEGKVMVEVTLDTEGNVTSAKAVSGHQLLRQSAEDAAKKSKFRPASFNGQPIKGTGVITYNFSLNPGGSE